MRLEIIMEQFDLTPNLGGPHRFIEGCAHVPQLSPVGCALCQVTGVLPPEVYISVTNNLNTHQHDQREHYIIYTGWFINQYFTLVLSITNHAYHHAILYKFDMQSILLCLVIFIPIPLSQN